MQDPIVFLVVEKGEPHERGKKITLSGKGSFLIGRESDAWRPDLAFTSLCVSRRHAIITSEEGRFYVSDLISKHGTSLNGSDIGHNRPHPLMHGDILSLADGTVIIVFNNLQMTGSDETLELIQKPDTDQADAIPEAGAGLKVIPHRREVLIDGEQVNLIGKDIELLLLLYLNRRKAVSYNEIKKGVWPERALDPENMVPDVGNDEITTLAYRLRKRLGSYGNLITAVPRYGYMLDL